MSRDPDAERDKGHIDGMRGPEHRREAWGAWNEQAREAVHIKPSEGPCQIHDWPTDGLGWRLMQAMRESHGKGGITVCGECVHRAKSDADAKRAARKGT